MDSNDRQAIERLFEKLAAVEGRSGPRDPEAEAFIRARLAAQPGAAYYMAQTIVVQEQALEAAQRRLEELEQPARREEGGLFGGLFGGGRPRYRRQREEDGYGAQPWGSRAGGGFLAGAAQTAMGVAGGVLLGNMLAGALFGGSEAEADDGAAEDGGDSGDFDGGDFDGGDFGDF